MDINWDITRAAGATPGPLDPEVRRALAVLEDAPNKKYYDEPADIKARDAYYVGPPDGFGPG